jgi:hypothetical protein
MSKLLTVVSVAGLLASQLPAQRAGGRVFGGVGSPVGPGSWGAGFAGRPAFGFGSRSFVGISPWVLPAFADDYRFPDGFQQDYAPQPNIIVVAPAQQPAPEPPPPPPTPAVPVVREYHWPETPDPHALFSIVASDGTVYEAAMVWVQGDIVHFRLPEGGSRQLPLSSVSRSLTQTANARKNLNLRLP